MKQVCSFCGGERSHRKVMVAGPPPLLICDECVELSAQCVADGLRQQGFDLISTQAARIAEARSRLDTLEIGTRRVLERLSLLFDQMDELLQETKGAEELTRSGIGGGK